MPSIEQIEQRLEAARLEVDRAGDTLNVRRGSGRGASKANIDPVPFLESLDPADEHRHVAGFVSGVKHALLEPDDSDAAEWPFKRAAGRLAMTIEVVSFRRGVEAVLGSPAWTRSFVDDLDFAFLIELDSGIRVLTERQFGAWSESADRVFEAGRSILFHKAENTRPTPLEEAEGVERLRVGDGCDAARCLVLDDLFFGEFDDSSRLGMPTREDLLFVREGTDHDVAALRRAVETRFDDAAYPLSDRLYRFDRSKPVPAD